MSDTEAADFLRAWVWAIANRPRWTPAVAEWMRKRNDDLEDHINERAE